MHDIDIKKIIERLRQDNRLLEAPVLKQMAHLSKEPFAVLITCLLSLRTKDEVTFGVSKRLFDHIQAPQDILKFNLRDLEKLIYPVGFYRNKAKIIHHVSSVLVERFAGQVPKTLDELLSIKGVGRKTANLVLTVAYGLLGICVDTHVHRISNRLGYVTTKTPDETEQALRKKLPLEYWIEINDRFVSLGQVICHPVSPRCSTCVLLEQCPKKGVLRSR